MLCALVADKGSPGVTTAALALAGAARAGDGPAPTSGEVLVVEADPGGGDLECWCGPLGEPGLLRAVTDVREQSSADRLRGHAVEVVDSVSAIVAPTSGPAAGAALLAASPGFAAALADVEGQVFVDCGRWLTSAPSLLKGVVDRADVVLVVCRPTLAGAEHTRSLLSTATWSGRQTAALVVGGNQPYGPEELSAALGVSVAGVLPWDPRGVRALFGHGASRGYLRSGLGIAAAETLGGLLAIQAAWQVGSRGG